MPFLPVGGQAVIEGVMMRSPSRVAVAVRRPDGTIALKERTYVSITRRHKLLALPIVRGAVSLIETLGLGIDALNYSADASSDEPQAPAKRAAWVSVGQALTVAIAFTLGVMLFVVAPAKVTSSWLGIKDRVGFGLVDGLLRLAAFVGYLLLISRWREMARVLGYHGAEHKAIHALENRAPLTPESVQTFSRFHPRCGTTFLFIVVVISIVVFTWIGRPYRLHHHLARVACMPLIVGVAFELIRLSGRYASHPLVRALIWPGMQFQRLTTREPDLSMCAVAVAALERVRVDDAVLTLEAAGERARPEVAFIQ